MFAQHNPVLNQAIQSSPDTFIQAGLFTLLSIQQPFHTLDTQLEDVKTNGFESRYLWPMKQQGYADLIEKGYWIHSQLLQLNLPKYPYWIPSALQLIADHVTGVGLVKAGFMVQLMFGQCACIDTINQQQFNIKKSTLDYKKFLSDNTRYKHAKNYFLLCESIGTSEFFWDNWCTNVSKYYPGYFSSPEEVSYYHLKLITGG